MTTSLTRALLVLGFAAVLALPLSGRQGPPAGARPPVAEPNRDGALDAASHDPAVALSRMQPAAGYDVQLFASEIEFPELAKPLAMSFDGRGRLWVLTSPTYPHALPGVTPNDKLLILEDTDHDGRADTAKVFADQLYLPMGFELGDGGVYVSQQPNLVFLRDTDGDDRADERRILLEGFGTEDAHHAIHAFQWGPGGDLYFQEGTFFHSQVETPYGAIRVDNGGVYRYEPRTAKLSAFVTYDFHNPWGHVVDRWGQHFISDASNGNNYWATPFSGHLDYPAKQDPLKVWTLTQVRPTAGIELVTSRQFPDSAQGNFLITNVIGFHGIKQYKVQDDGAGFVGVEVEPLLQSSDLNFRPVGIQFGPDGALYVVDWFNPLIGHMQYSMRDARRDKERGRIWRVTAKGRPLATPPAITGQPIAAQLELLKAYEDRTRYRARLALRERPAAEVIAALDAWTKGLDPRDAGYEHHLLEALWVSEHHDVVNVGWLKQLLAARDMRARAAAVRVLQHWFDRVDGGMALLRTAVADPEIRVRVEAVRALSFVPTVEAATVAVEALKQSSDYYLDYTLRSTVRALEPAWHRALSQGAAVAAGNPAGLAYLLDCLEPADLAALPGSIPVYEALLRRPGIEASARSMALEGLAAARSRSTAEELLAALGRVDGVPGRTAVIRDLTGLMAGVSQPALVAARPALERMALNARVAATREAAFLAIVRADGGLDNAWRLAATPLSRVDLLGGVTRLDDRTLWPAVYDRVRAQLDAPAAAVDQSVRGRYVRITLPGRGRNLSLAEVEVMSGGANIARAGAASQSSVMADGAVGGNASAAIDGRTDGTESAASFTNDQSDPWWELDLGAARSIDRITVWNRTDAAASTLDGFHLQVFDDTRQPLVTVDSLPAPDPSVTIDIGANQGGRLNDAAIASLAHVPDRDVEIFRLLTTFIERGQSQRMAIDTARRIPRARWPAGGLGPLAAAVATYAQSIPAGERTTAAFTDVVAFARDLARDLPASERTSINASLDDATVRVIQIMPIVGALQWDVKQFSVQPNELVELVVVNPDTMPHNLLITAPGKLEAVGRAAEAMSVLPDAFERQFVPDTPDVLFKTALIGTNETARLRFRAPAQTGAYPYVCSFPGHWGTMNGIMQVTGGGRRGGGRPAGPPPGAGGRGAGPPGGVPVRPTR